MDILQELQERMLRSAQQLTRELIAAGADIHEGDITVERTSDGAVVRFGAVPTTVVSEAPAPDEANG